MVKVLGSVGDSMSEMISCADGKLFTIVMRKDAVYTVLLNTTLFKGMKCSYAPQDQRYLRFSTFDRIGTLTHYNLRVGMAFALFLGRSVLIDIYSARQHKDRW